MGCMITHKGNVVNGWTSGWRPVKKEGQYLLFTDPSGVSIGSDAV